MIILHSFADNLSLTIPGDDVADFLATLQGPYLEVDEADLPDAPREAWLVNWKTGVVSVDPAWIPPTAPVVTDWDRINQAILIDPDWNMACSVVRGIAPGIVEALPAAMLQISSDQPTMFAFLFQQICTIASVGFATRESWAQIAEAHHAPPVFIKIVRGVINGE